MTIYVGNFDNAVTDADLRTLFEPFGVVTKVAIRCVGGKAFANVEMPDSAQAQAAIDALTGSRYRGKRLMVADCEYD